MNKVFKEGDEVRCINTVKSGMMIKVGSVYTVSFVSDNLKSIILKGLGSYTVGQFELYNKTLDIERIYSGD